jgi:hypothetical protein
MFLISRDEMVRSFRFVAAQVIEHLYEDGKGRAGTDKQARARLLKEIRTKEHEWITRAKCKAEYQATVRGVMESLR